MDALLALRTAIKGKAPVTYLDATGVPTTSLSVSTHLVLSSGVTLPKSTSTRFRKPGADNDFFTLEAIYVAWLLKEVSGAEYMRQAREFGLAVGFVSVTERKGVVDWLEGRRAEHDSIVPEADPPTPKTPPSASSALPTDSILPSTTPTASSNAPAKRRYVPDPKDVEIVKKIKLNEVELRDRNSVLHGTKDNNFSNVRALVAERLKRFKEAGKTGTVTPKPDPKAAARKARLQIPIIMISSSPTALITMYNVKKLLEEAIFEPSQDARVAAGNAKPEDVVVIYRKRTHVEAGGKETEINSKYFVVDGIEALAKFGTGEPWDRVVCVMTTGQAWQFKPYKWSEPRQLFHHVKGIYVSWTNDPPNPKIKDWNVTELKIDPHRRHVDKSVVAHFWKTLDSWTSTHKPWLHT